MTIQEVFDYAKRQDPFYFTRDYMTEQQIQDCQKCKLPCGDTSWKECPIMR